MSKLLLDTGPFVALLDRSDAGHETCADFFHSYRGRIFSTEPVLTETMYLLGPAVKPQLACLEFIINRAVIMVPQSPASLSRAASLMNRYRDIPMDFADATLVVLAEETGIHEVFTLDMRGFKTYRIHGKKRFKLYPLP